MQTLPLIFIVSLIKLCFVPQTKIELWYKSKAGFSYQKTNLNSINISNVEMSVYSTKCSLEWKILLDVFLAWFNSLSSVHMPNEINVHKISHAHHLSASWQNAFEACEYRLAQRQRGRQADTWALWANWQTLMAHILWLQWDDWKADKSIYPQYVSLQIFVKMLYQLQLKNVTAFFLYWHNGQDVWWSQETNMSAQLCLPLKGERQRLSLLLSLSKVISIRQKSTMRRQTKSSNWTSCQRAHCHNGHKMEQAHSRKAF